MAEFEVQGLEEFMLSMKELAEIPDEVQDEMLNAGADVVVPVQKKKIKAYGIYDSKSAKHVSDSIKKGKVKTKKGKRVIYITPTGSKKRGKTVTRNAEILFVNEYGKRGQKARPAIRDANEECARATTDAQAQVWDEYLKKNNL